MFATRFFRLMLSLAGIVVAASPLFGKGMPKPGETFQLVSIGLDGQPGNKDTCFSTLSKTGRFIAFLSPASNLVPGDVNESSDVFVRDVKQGTTELIAAVGGSPADGRKPAISGSGRFVAFESSAIDLVADDTNASCDVFVADRKKHKVRRVSIASSGAQASESCRSPVISRNGRYIAFVSVADDLVADDQNDEWDVFVHDCKKGVTSRVSVSSSGAEANGLSSELSISANGRFVAFASDASNLMTGDHNGRADVFVHDRKSGTTERISVTSDGGDSYGGGRAPSLSANGRWVAFQSQSPDLDPDCNSNSSEIYVRDRKTESTRVVSIIAGASGGGSTNPQLSANGKVFAFERYGNVPSVGDHNGKKDVFLKSIDEGTTKLATAFSSGVGLHYDSGMAALSGNGKLVAFGTHMVIDSANATAEVFVRRP